MPVKTKKTSRSSASTRKEKRRKPKDLTYNRRENIERDDNRRGRGDTDRFGSQDLYDAYDTGTARAEYSPRRYDRRNVGQKSYHREGNIIQRAADKLREVWEDLVSSRDDEYDNASYRSRRRNVYNSEEDPDVMNWRRENLDDLSEHDPEHHYRDKVHRQPFYDDGRQSSHYNNQYSGGRNPSKRRSGSSANEWQGRSRRGGSRYSSSDNYHARNDEYNNRYYERDRDRD